jgi:hypothetical protein
MSMLVCHERPSSMKRVSPPVAIERLSLTPQGHIRYARKTPYRDGTTPVIFEPLDFLARLVSLVPSPRVNLTRFHGIFAANHRRGAQILPGKRGRGRRPYCPNNRTMRFDVQRLWQMRRGGRGTDTLRCKFPAASASSNAPPDVRRLGQALSVGRDPVPPRGKPRP